MKDTFRTGFRSCLKSFSKQYGPQIFQHIQKLRLEIYEQNRMRISLTHENESRPALVWSFTFDGIPKDRAARKCVDILMGGWRSLGILQPKTFEDFEIV